MQVKYNYNEVQIWFDTYVVMQHVGPATPRLKVIGLLIFLIVEMQHLATINTLTSKNQNISLACVRFSCHLTDLQPPPLFIVLQSLSLRSGQGQHSNITCPQ